MSRTRRDARATSPLSETEQIKAEAAELTDEKIRARLNAAASEHQALVEKLAREALKHAALIGDSEARLAKAVERSQKESERGRELAARIRDLEASTRDAEVIDEPGTGKAIP